MSDLSKHCDVPQANPVPDCPREVSDTSLGSKDIADHDQVLRIALHPDHIDEQSGRLKPEFLRRDELVGHAGGVSLQFAPKFTQAALNRMGRAWLAKNPVRTVEKTAFVRAGDLRHGQQALVSCVIATPSESDVSHSSVVIHCVQRTSAREATKQQRQEVLRRFGDPVNLADIGLQPVLSLAPDNLD